MLERPRRCVGVKAAPVSTRERSDVVVLVEDTSTVPEATERRSPTSGSRPELVSSKRWTFNRIQIQKGHFLLAPNKINCVATNKVCAAYIPPSESQHLMKTASPALKMRLQLLQSLGKCTALWSEGDYDTHTWPNQHVPLTILHRTASNN